MGRTAEAVSVPAAERPPGTGLPAFVQTGLFMGARDRFLPWCWRRYGDLFTVRLLGRATTVVLNDPEHIKQVFSGSAETFHAGEGNEILRPLLGDHSLLTMDEDAHRRARRMLMPAFNGAALRSYAGMISEIACDQVARWPTGRVTALHPWLQKLTLEVILRVVFGVTDAHRLRRMRDRIRVVTDIGPVTFLSALVPQLRSVPPARGSWRGVVELDRLLFDEIAERRGAPDLHERTDVLSLMLRSGGDGGDERMSDQELRDELVTLVMAGHETTATGLAWTFHELARHPRLLAKATEAADEGDDDYLEAVFKEALRLRPVIYAVARKLTIDTEVGGYRLPAGTIVSPSIGIPQRDDRRFARPTEFDPERFRTGRPPGTDWLPFGGGIRRCIGAGFATTEAVQILRAALRAHHYQPDRWRPERARGRNVTLIPHRKTRVRLSTR